MSGHDEFDRDDAAHRGDGSDEFGHDAHDPNGHGDAHDDHAGHESYREQSGETRTTAPMQRYSVSQAGVGATVLAVGVAVAYLLPVLAA